ncbi:ribbon-helix-helix domain-containing protein [uncultured Pseudoteredinibacter sp.]|uniref:ribbon-helix-helix domain-containing protein n=1 Tax=uncultured Pseudoteredinibacter sp. TaxID=1641701 RepID=UPI002632A804|nr:ribbon-helix-helix domain-containing protein [uncultured Pseudoteredinibacter sp.]
MDKTTSVRQQRYRKQIAKGDKKRLQVVIDREEAEKLDDICAIEGVSKTEFIKNAIAQHSQPEKNNTENTKTHSE